MSDARRTRLNTELTNRGLSLTQALTMGELDEVRRVVAASGATLSKAADVTASADQFVLAPAASQTNTLTIQALVPGPAAGIVTVAVADAGNDTLAVTNVAGVLAIALANTTDSKNTLTLIKAAIDASNSSTLGVTHSVATFVTGTGSTQMVHGGTNTLVAVAAGGTAGTSLKSSTAGALGAGVLAVNPA